MNLKFDYFFFFPLAVRTTPRTLLMSPGGALAFEFVSFASPAFELRKRGFLFLFAFASGRHLLPPLPSLLSFRQKLSCASVPLLLLGCSCSVSAQNQGKRAKVHFVLICSLCLEAQAKRSNKNKNKCNRGQEECEHLLPPLVTWPNPTLACAVWATGPHLLFISFLF